MIGLKSATAHSESKARKRKIDDRRNPIRHKVVVVKSDLLLLDRSRDDRSSDEEHTGSEDIKH